jgi:hypothetical protein
MGWKMIDNWKCSWVCQLNASNKNNLERGLEKATKNGEDGTEMNNETRILEK